MLQIRTTIYTGPDGLLTDQRAALESAGFALRAQLPHDERAVWPGEVHREPGRQYIYLVEARDMAQAERRARTIVGSDLRIRVMPHGGRVTSEGDQS